MLVKHHFVQDRNVDRFLKGHVNNKLKNLIDNCGLTKDRTRAGEDDRPKEDLVFVERLVERNPRLKAEYGAID